jgi:hypothetical protein
MEKEAMAACAQLSQFDEELCVHHAFLHCIIVTIGAGTK